MSKLLQFPIEAEARPPQRPAQPRSVALERLGAAATGGGAPNWLNRYRAFAGPLALLLLWQAGASSGLLDPRSLAPPSAVIAAARDLLASGELQGHFWVSLTRVVYGLGIGVVAGVVLAVAAGLFRLGEDMINSSVNMLRMIPVIALLPLIIVWMGIGEPAKITIIVIGTTFPVYMNTFAAIRGVDQKLIEAGRAYGLRRWGLIRRIVLPGALPGFLVGFRWALGAAWLLLFFAEMINADTGIGYLINQAQAWNRTDIIFLGLTIYASLGLAGDLVVTALERALLSWRRGFQGT
jgi:sulfonate transport system permease protein